MMYNAEEEKRKSKAKFWLALLATFVVMLVPVAVFWFSNDVDIPNERADATWIKEYNIYYYALEETRQFHIPSLDLRGFELDYFEMKKWFLERINYHREAYGIHPYSLYAPAIITSIEHSLDMRNNDFGSTVASDGRVHQERHDRWFGYDRTVVTSAHASTHEVSRQFTQEGAIEIVDRIISRERTREFLLNPTYYYIGIGFSIQANATGRLSITMVSLPNERQAHRNRSPEERIEHRQQYLERVRYERGWIAP